MGAWVKNIARTRSMDISNMSPLSVKTFLSEYENYFVQKSTCDMTTGTNAPQAAQLFNQAQTQWVTLMSCKI